jgi:acetoin utilization deacetylase AcuC-like enzyme
MKTRLYTHNDCLGHEMQPGHPERPDRLRAVIDHLSATGLMAELDSRTPQPAAQSELERVHDPGYVRAIYASSPRTGLVALDPDTAMGPMSLAAAEFATGATIDAVREVLEGKAQRAFCAVRPPGHHAERDQAMGFCLFNSVAVGAAAALTQVARVAILDFDVHHGNGTVDIFRDRPEVLVCSSFQHPHYPHRLFDVRAPNIVNTPLPAGTAGLAFRRAIERDWLPAIERHRPELVLVSAGFDGHRADPLGGFELVEDDFRWITELIVALANEHAKGRVVSTLEGGYDLTALARSVAVHIEALLD